MKSVMEHWLGAVWSSRAALLTVSVRRASVQATLLHKVPQSSTKFHNGAQCCCKLGPALIEQTNGLRSGLAHTRAYRYIGPNHTRQKHPPPSLIYFMHWIYWTYVCNPEKNIHHRVQYMSHTLHTSDYMISGTLACKYFLYSL